MGRKFFVWSFDDGLEQDKKIIEILRSCQMGATFNLNSGLYGKRQVIKRIGTMGLHAVPVSEFEKKKIHLLKHAPHRRIPEDEVCQVYDGFEIASHTRGHERLTNLTEAEMRATVAGDITALSQKFGKAVTGFAYPYGAYNDTVKSVLRQCGVSYARTVTETKSFLFPADPLATDITGWHIHAGIFDKLDAFLKAPEQEEDMLFLMFAHGYEFDFYVRESSWDKFKRICDRAAGHDDIICCSMQDAFSQHRDSQLSLASEKNP